MLDRRGESWGGGVRQGQKREGRAPAAGEGD